MQTLYIFINTYVYYEFTVVCIGILFIFKMQRQRVRVRRRAAATDLTVRDPATLTPELNDQPRGRKCPRNNPSTILPMPHNVLIKQNPCFSNYCQPGSVNTSNSRSNCSIYDCTAEGSWPAANSLQW